MMEYYNLIVPILLTTLASSTIGLPVNNKDVKEETIAVYIPYDVKYVPVEVPGKFINAEPSNSKGQETLEPIVLRQGDVLNYLQNKTRQDAAIKPVFTDAITTKTDGESSTNGEDLVVIPVSTLTEALKANTQLKSVEDEESNSDAPSEFNSVKDHEKQEEESSTSKFENSPVKHRLSKRQAPRFPFYRPVLRFSRIRGSRTRLSESSRRPALVGYLNDRDFFPTVA